MSGDILDTIDGALSERAANLGRTTVWSAADWQDALEWLWPFPPDDQERIVQWMIRVGWPPWHMPSLIGVLRNMTTQITRIVLAYRRSQPPPSRYGAAYRQRQVARRRRRR